MPDDIKQKREALKGKLLGEFNKVAPKVMKVNDLADNFEKDDNKYFRWYQKPKELIIEHFMRGLLNKVPAEAGVYEGVENGKTITYVSSDFLKNRLIKAIDEGKADSYLDDAEKAGLAAVDAVRDTQDQSDRVRSGQLKPKQPRPQH